MSNRAGQQFGNYRLIRLLGQGGFADVYLAEHIHLETLSAVKILSIRLTSEHIDHFRTEARTVARLVHPHIVRVLDFGVEDDTPYLVMDYAPNGSLRHYHAKGTHVPLSIIVNYVKQVAEALQYAHDNKLIHRDIKPDNILIGGKNEILLSDFGIASLAHSTRSLNTQEGSGTIYYMAPEQIQGKPRIASDQYALGIVVYEWISGVRPFNGTAAEIGMQQLLTHPPSLREKVPTIPADIEQVVFTALAKDPQQRFASVQAFAIALEQASQMVQTNFFPSTIEITPLSQPLSPTVQAIPLSQTSPQTNSITPPGKLSQPTTMTPVPTVSSSFTGESLVRTQQPTQHHISRRLVLIGLVGLAITGGGITWLENSQKPQVTSTFQPSSNSTTPSNSSAGVSTSTSNSPTVGSTSISNLSPSSSPTSQAPALGTTINTYTGHNAGLRALAWATDNKRVVTASDDYTAQAWDALSGKNAIIYHGHSSYVEGVAWSSDNSLIVSGSADGTAQIWDATTGNHVYTYQGHINAYTGSCCQSHPWVNRVSWSHDGKHICSCDQASDPSRSVTAQIWEAATGITLVTYRGHKNGIYAISWSPDDSRIASAGYDGTLQIWDAKTGTSIASYGGSAFLFGLSWSPNGNYVAVGSSDNTILVVNASSGSLLNTYSGHSNWVKDVAWSPDGKYIASGSDDGLVILWNTSNGVNSYAYNGHSGHINAVEWSSDGKLIASGGDTTEVWQAT